MHFKLYLRSVIKRPTDGATSTQMNSATKVDSTTNEQTSTTSGQTSTVGGQMSTASG